MERLEMKHIRYRLSIINRKAGTILTAGIPSSQKKVGSNIFISLDDIHYFNIAGNGNYQVAKDIADTDIPLTKIPEHYNIVPWMERENKDAPLC